MAMKGKIVSWKDDKGFGFISVEGQVEKIFFHISSVKKAARKPVVGDQVVFEAAKDSQGRLKATYVLLEGVRLASPGAAKRIITEPVKKDAIDYFAYFALFFLLVASFVLYLRSGSVEFVLVVGAVFVAVLFFLLGRKKQPASKLFSCAKCRSISEHDERTVLAWNRGFDRLYCKACHQKWLSEKPQEYTEKRDYYSSSKSGCLGSFVVIASLPILCVAGVIKLLA